MAEREIEPEGVGSPEPAADAESLIWLQATISDIENVSFEEPIAECDSADCRDLSDLFREAAQSNLNVNVESAAPAFRVFAMLAAVTSFHFKPTDPSEPFGAMEVLSDQRSAVPGDFRGNPVLVLANAAERARNPVLRARLSDLCWLLERKRHGLGRTAVGSYVEVVERLGVGQLKDRLEVDEPIIGLTTRDLLQRALTIGRAAGWDQDEVAAARDLVSKSKVRAVELGQPAQVHWFYEIDLEFGISSPAEAAKELEEFARKQAAESRLYSLVEIWRLAARAYHYARDADGKYRSYTEAAETLVAEAESQGSAILASHWLGVAIAEYHGIPGKRERRTALRHKLIDVQSGIPEEMSSFSHPMDLKDLTVRTESELQGDHSLLDILLMFSELGRSPDPDTLAKDAASSIRDHPLSSLFGMSFHDSDGKVIHRTKSGEFGDDRKSDAVRAQIAQQESIRRKIIVSGSIHVARQFIMDRYYLSEEFFVALLHHSPSFPLM